MSKKFFSPRKKGRAEAAWRRMSNEQKPMLINPIHLFILNEAAVLIAKGTPFSIVQKQVQMLLDAWNEITRYQPPSDSSGEG